jgi:hypothetical protein
MASRQHKAVLVLPDVGLNEKQVGALKEEFGNSLVSSLRRVGGLGGEVTITIQIEIVFVFARE